MTWVTWVQVITGVLQIGMTVVMGYWWMRVRDDAGRAEYWAGIAEASEKSVYDTVKKIEEIEKRVS